MRSKYQIYFALSCHILVRLSLLCIKNYSYEFFSYFFIFFYSYVFVCIRMYRYVSRMLLVCYSFVSRMYPYVLVCSVCYSYVTPMLPVCTGVVF